MMIEEFTIKQLAELLEVSKPTVQKAIKDLNIKPKKIDNINRGFYSYEDSVSVIKKIKPDFNLSAVGIEPPNFSESTAKPQNEPPNLAQNRQINRQIPPSTAKPQNEELELMRTMLETIQEQLKEKDKQLAIKDKQIQDLSDRLAEAMQLTRGQQYIAAADKTTELLEADTKKGQAQEPEEREKEAAAAAPMPPVEKAESKEEPRPPQKRRFFRRFFRK